MSLVLWSVVIPLLIAVFLIYRLVKKELWMLFGADSNENNPFHTYARSRKGAPVVTDLKARDKVLKQSFSPDKIPSKLDAIVIGSGIGGLSAAALLAKTGKSVLVLDQHDQAGGCCHTFVDKGFEFDVGIHYVGEMAEGRVSRVLVDQLSESGIEWTGLESTYDTVILGMGQEPSERKTFPILSGRGELMESLLKRFPKEEKGIRKFFDLLKRLRKVTPVVALMKILPKWFASFIVSSGLAKMWHPDLKYCLRSLTDVLNEIVGDEELKAVLGYSFGDYGTIPKDASFMMQASLTTHFMFGGYYPVGGSSEIAFNIIPTIEAAGGRVLIRASVTNILMSDSYSHAVGVSVKQGHTVYDIFAPIIISDAGVYNTYEKLLPSQAVGKFGLGRTLSRVRHGLALMSVFIGLDGTKEELGLKPSNVWAFTGANMDKIMEDYLSKTPEEASQETVPLMFLSFPSTKDPTYSDRFPGKTTVAIVTVCPYEWFEAWKDEGVQHRGDDYNGLKNAIGTQLWHQVLDLYPQLEGRKVYMDVGTPLSNMYYLGTPQGEVYGIDHDVSRFSLEALSELRPDIGIPGLYMTGQDVFFCGFSGAMFGGVLCASAILKRNLLQDIIVLTKKTNKEAKKSE